MKVLQYLSLSVLTFAVGIAGAQSSSLSVAVDLTDTPKKIIHATEKLNVVPGAITLVYPKWIPGEHAPDGPIDDMAGFFAHAQDANGNACGDSHALKSDALKSDALKSDALKSDALKSDALKSDALKWQRDKIDMYAIHLTVPVGCTVLSMKIDFLATAAPTGFSAGASTSENLAMLSWNTVVLYPQGVDAADVKVTPSITLPSAWQFGTALHRTNTPAGSGATYDVAFEPVTLEQLVDSPVLTGRYFKEIPLATEVTPKHFLDIAADGPEELELPAARIENFNRLVRETGALYQSRHYGEYHFLVTLSDSVAHFGLEHHESSDDRIPAKTFTENDRFVLAGSLLPHEFTHSWNGKYRRPADLATSNYQKPMEDDLLWVYEGLTEYFGDVLAARSGLWTPEQYRGMLASSAASLDNWPGRTWRNLQDTATMASVLYFAGGGWDNWRRGTDFYAEGELIWLDTDVTIRKLTGGKNSLNDFAAKFEGLGGNTPPKVVPYTFDDVVAGLNAVVPYDWAKFLRERLDTNQPHAPLGGIEQSGYKLTYTSRPNPWNEIDTTVNGRVDFWFSLGLRADAGGKITDVLKGGVADKAGLGPGMQIIAVDGRAFTPTVMRTAIKEAQDAGQGPEVIAQNSGFFRVAKLDYTGGERYPTLERVEGTPDILDQIVAPMVAE